MVTGPAGSVAEGERGVSVTLKVFMQTFAIILAGFFQNLNRDNLVQTLCLAPLWGATISKRLQENPSFPLSEKPP
jgi:hypothetical protein